jgi:hypothetical protein
MDYVLAKVVFAWVSQSLAAQTDHLWSAGWRCAKAILILILITGCLLSQSATAAPVKEVRRVLIFHGIGLTSPVAVLVQQEIDTALRDSPYRIELYSRALSTFLVLQSCAATAIGKRGGPLKALG